MNAIIINNLPQPFGGGSARKSNRTYVGRPLSLLSSFINRRLVVALGALLLCLNFDICPWGGPLPAFGQNFTVTPIMQVTIDADGKEIRYPYFLFYDRTFDEVYLTANGGAQIIIYSSDFFPLISFASGRGVDNPNGGFIDKDGTIYICQGRGKGKKARISIFNGAFILSREIFFDEMPQAPKNFTPQKLVVNRDGLIYVAGEPNNGVMVLDNDGNFQRWVQPMDEIWMSKEQIAALEKQEAEKEAKAAEAAAENQAAENQENAEATEEENNGPQFEIPEQFRPKTEEEKRRSGPHIGPVTIISVTIDSDGRLYLLSLDTSKTYVYDANETFLFSFGVKGGTPRTLSQPRAEAIDEENRIIYVVDFMRHEIVAYDQDDGSFLFEFGGKGFGPAFFNFPTDIIVNRNGRLAISDLFNHRIQLLDVKYQRDSTILQSSP